MFIVGWGYVSEKLGSYRLRNQLTFMGDPVL